MATPARTVVAAELLLDGGGVRPIPLDELEQLERDRNQDVLENVVMTYSDGERLRPYRFSSVSPVELDGDTIVF